MVLRTREWVGVLVIVVLIQFMITYVSFDFGTSGRALGFVSFAGTVVSIIIGVVAILYSFYQSNSQANVVSDIKDQAVRIVEAGDHIVKSKENLYASADKLMMVAEDLATKLQENNERNAEFKDLLTNSLSTVRGDAASGTLRGDLLDTKYYYLDTCYLILNEFAVRDWEWDKLHEQIIKPYAKGAEFSEDVVAGSVMALVCLFGSLNLIEAEGDGVGQVIEFVDQDFARGLRKLARNIRSLEDKPPIVKAYIDVINSLDNPGAKP
ncbi:hypothetical protein ACIPM0_04165 [Pseudomonas sichuanensis]|uniref:hypothetical protein n=1 Tax=Pseudomonas sichuanensis TaxID=2213015 RepID=UPI003807360E